MKIQILGLLFGLAVSAQSATNLPASPNPDTRISIAFVHPENFTDANSSRFASERERTGLLRELGAAMQRSAGSYLRPDLRLVVQVTDLDLAGDLENGRSASFSGVRFMRDVYPPRMTITYRLLDARGRVLDEGETKLSNLDFLFGAAPDTDPLRFDKSLFRDWVRGKLTAYRK